MGFLDGPVSLVLDLRLERSEVVSCIFAGIAEFPQCDIWPIELLLKKETVNFLRNRLQGYAQAQRKCATLSKHKFLPPRDGIVDCSWS